ncbi:MAG TPA: hypothetical protein VFN56_05005 [Candidatus Saccharimonadales bacterium]|nr:hypothetical protein [Candidatus Saccharimonadales bacterium]
MSLSWKDILNTVLAAAGVTLVWARLHDYTWWLIGSWKGAMATLGALGLVLLVVNMSEMADLDNWFNFGESLLWVATAAVIVTGLFTASEALFITAAIMLGVLYAGILGRHVYHSMHHPSQPYVAAQ